MPHGSDALRSHRASCRERSRGRCHRARLGRRLRDTGERPVLAVSRVHRAHERSVSNAQISCERAHRRRSKPRIYIAKVNTSLDRHATQHQAKLTDSWRRSSHRPRTQAPPRGSARVPPRRRGLHLCARVSPLPLSWRSGRMSVSCAGRRAAPSAQARRECDHAVFEAGLPRIARRSGGTAGPLRDGEPPSARLISPVIRPSSKSVCLRRRSVCLRRRSVCLRRRSFGAAATATASRRAPTG